MTSRWSSNVFKGRIGEAIVEAVLSEFGYTVQHCGYEMSFSTHNPLAPDLIVTNPKSGGSQYVEVKYRSARPTSVQLDADRIAKYATRFPHTILAISSAWDASIFCAQVEDLPIAKGNGVATLSLLEEYWSPIWHYFPFVKRGERLRQTWKELQRAISTFGTRQLLGRPDRKLWEGEYEALIRYLDGMA
ncbi:MAG: hypothetical protein HY666_03130 [Chloroflexi bacterium]|nr:hypothetical protein [Chloroflexota bacterium]